ncbi:uncharacterized protein LOC144346760, partial [Saccoglossus kowalevskii]
MEIAEEPGVEGAVGGCFEDELGCSILVSNVPASKTFEPLLDKLEAHFMKSKYGGGDIQKIQVHSCDKDQLSVVITYNKLDANSYQTMRNLLDWIYLSAGFTYIAQACLT